MDLFWNALICASTVLECSCWRIHRYVAAPVYSICTQLHVMSQTTPGLYSRVPPALSPDPTLLNGSRNGSLAMSRIPRPQFSFHTKMKHFCYLSFYAGKTCIKHVSWNPATRWGPKRFLLDEVEGFKISFLAEYTPEDISLKIVCNGQLCLVVKCESTYIQT